MHALLAFLDYREVQRRSGSVGQLHHHHELVEVLIGERTTRPRHIADSFGDLAAVTVIHRSTKLDTCDLQLPSLLRLWLHAGDTFGYPYSNLGGRRSFASMRDAKSRLVITVGRRLRDLEGHVCRGMQCGKRAAGGDQGLNP